jgi:hypothetical protein
MIYFCLHLRLSTPSGSRLRQIGNQIDASEAPRNSEFLRSD